jgi:hypothetical protein
VRRLGLPVLVLCVVGGLGWWGWHTTGQTSVPWPALGIALAVVAGLALVARLRLLVPVLVLGAAAGLGWLLWQAGTRWTTATVAGGLAIVGVLLTVVAASRRSDYRGGAYVMWPSVAATLAFTAAVGWLLRGAGLNVLLVVAVPAACGVVAVASRLRHTARLARFDRLD